MAQSMESEIKSWLSWYTKRYQEVIQAWQLIVECFDSQLIDMKFSTVNFSFPDSVTVAFLGEDKEWINKTRRLFEAKGNVYWGNLESSSYSWDRGRVQCTGVIYADPVNQVEPIFKVILKGPPTAKCRKVRIAKVIEAQEAVEEHVEYEDSYVCGDDLPADAEVIEEE